MVTDQSDFRYQGVLGFSPDHSEEVPNYLIKLREEGKIDEATVSFSLGHNSTQRNDVMPSFVIFGGIDNTEYVGDLIELPSKSKQFWAPSIQGFAYGGNYIAKFGPGTTKLGIIDTGTALIHLPKEYYDALVGKWKKQIYRGFSKNKKNGLWEAAGSCENYNSRVSNITFVMNGRIFDITP